MQAPVKSMLFNLLISNTSAIAIYNKTEDTWLNPTWSLHTTSVSAFNSIQDEQIHSRDWFMEIHAKFIIKCCLFKKIVGRRIFKNSSRKTVWEAALLQHLAFSFILISAGIFGLVTVLIPMAKILGLRAITLLFKQNNLQTAKVET